MYIKVAELNHILPDNDVKYFKMLEGVINSVDVNSEVYVYKKPAKYSIRINPSCTGCLNTIIGEILKFHNYINITIDLSKSIKTSGKIFFDLHINKCN